MPSLSDVLRPDLLEPLYLLTLCGFVGVTSTFMLVSVINRARVHNVFQTWPRRGGWSWPVCPVAFLVLSFALLVASLWFHHEPAALTLFGYLAGGLFWLVAATLARTTYVTEQGLTHSINCPGEQLLWRHVTDYFCTSHEEDKAQRYVFFHRREGEHQRFEITVPAAHAKRFQRTVRFKVDEGLEERSRRIYDRETLEE